MRRNVISASVVTEQHPLVLRQTESPGVAHELPVGVTFSLSLLGRPFTIREIFNKLAFILSIEALKKQNQAVIPQANCSSSSASQRAGSGAQGDPESVGVFFCD